jgi:hypothetical protein
MRLGVAMRTGFHTGARKSERGASLVEFAIAATVFLTVTFAVWNLVVRFGFITHLLMQLARARVMQRSIMQPP